MNLENSIAAPNTASGMMQEGKLKHAHHINILSPLFRPRRPHPSPATNLGTSAPEPSTFCLTPKTMTRQPPSPREKHQISPLWPRLTLGSLRNKQKARVAQW